MIHLCTVFNELGLTRYSKYGFNKLSQDDLQYMYWSMQPLKAHKHIKNCPVIMLTIHTNFTHK